jgi:hypothetical protein
MSLLDDLLTLDYERESKPLLFLPRTWKHLLPWHNVPFCYKIHQTMAGIPVVLPHDKEDELFVHPIKKFTEIKPGSSWLQVGNGFYLQQTFARSNEKSLLMGSNVAKRVYNPELRMGTDIILSTLVNDMGVPITFSIYYDLQLHGNDQLKVYFKVRRSSYDDRPVVTGPMIETNMNYPTIEKGWHLNYDTTLENLLSQVMPEQLTEEEMMSLIKLSYLDLNVLH